MNLEKDDHHREAIRSLFDDVKAELGWAVQNIRHEVVEKGWFGERVTPESVHMLSRDQEPDKAAEHEADREPERDLEQDQDLER